MLSMQNKYEIIGNMYPFILVMYLQRKIKFMDSIFFFSFYLYYTYVRDKFKIMIQYLHPLKTHNYIETLLE